MSGWCLNYLKRSLKPGGLVEVVFCNKLLWFVSELPENDISNLHGGLVEVVFCNKLPSGLCLNYLKTISQTCMEV